MRRIGLVLGLLPALANIGPAQLLQGLARRQEGRSMRASSGRVEDNADALHLAPGETRTLADLAGPGTIKHIWFTAHSLDIRYPRALVLRVYWDGAKVPSVESPLGDFFAVGNGMQADVNSLPVKVSSYGRGYNCYWEMPFARRALITMTNESPAEQATLYFQIDWVDRDSLPKEPEGPLYFHARYHQEHPPEMCAHYTVFRGKGRGHYVGTVLSSQNAIGHWYGEGDDLVFIDGGEQPALVGTGTEDYFNEAWNMRVHSGLYNGCTVFEPRAIDARISAYRWHLADPILFEKSLRMEIERTGFIMDSKGEVVSQHGYRPDYWSSVSFWYQDSIAEPWCPFPPYAARVNEEIVVHLPRIVDRIRHSAGVALEVGDYCRVTWTKPWFRARNDSVGEWIEIPFCVKKPGRYSISLFQHLREDNGIYRVLLDGKELAEAGEVQIAGGYRVDQVRKLPAEGVNRTLDFFNIFRKNDHEDLEYGQRRERKIGLFRLEPGEHALRLVCVGANPLSRHPETGKPGYNLSADVLSARLLPFGDMDAWIGEMLERMRAAGEKR